MRAAIGHPIFKAGAFLVAAVALPHLLREIYYQQILVLICLWSMLGMAWNVVGGYAGQPSLGIVTLYGVAAFASTLAEMHLGINPWLAGLVGVGAAVTVAVFIGYPCFHLKTYYFAIATLAMNEVVITVFRGWGFVGANYGLVVPARPEGILNFLFASKTSYYYVILAFLTATVVAVYVMERRRLGLYLRAIKSDPEAAASLGINTMKHKLIAYVISAIIAGTAGVFYARLVLYVSPDTVLHWRVSLQAILVTVLGGIGTIAGPIAGSVVLVLLSEGTHYAFGGQAAVDLMLYGLSVVVIALFEPSGLSGLWKRVRKRTAG